MNESGDNKLSKSSLIGLVIGSMIGGGAFNIMSDTCVVVTRYFGGIKLGGGGLIRAYSGAVRDVIYDVGRVELREAVPCIVTLNYDQTGKFEYELASTHFMLRNQTYTDKVSYYIDVVKSDYEAFINFLNQMTAGNFDLTEETPKQLPFDIPTE